MESGLRLFLRAKIRRSGNVPLLPLREKTGWQIIDAIRGRVPGARDR